MPGRVKRLLLVYLALLMAIGVLGGAAVGAAWGEWESVITMFAAPLEGRPLQPQDFVLRGAIRGACLGAILVPAGVLLLLGLRELDRRRGC